VEWAASMQAYYAAGGQPYAWHAAQVHATDRPTVHRLSIRPRRACSRLGRGAGFEFD
jgi:hypothetical protein